MQVERKLFGFSSLKIQTKIAHFVQVTAVSFVTTIANGKT